MELVAGDTIEILEMIPKDDGADPEWHAGIFQAFTRDEDGTPAVIFSDEAGFLRVVGLYGMQVRIQTIK